MGLAASYRGNTLVDGADGLVVHRLYFVGGGVKTDLSPGEDPQSGTKLSWALVLVVTRWSTLSWGVVDMNCGLHTGLHTF